MSEIHKKYKRRQLLSNPRAQIKIIFAFTFLAVLYAVANYYVAKSTLWSFSAGVLRLSLSEANRADINLLLQQQGATLDLQLALFTLLTCVVITLGGLLLSHRLAGPIYQLRKYLCAMVDGTVKPRRIRFRKLDFFHELAESFNAFQESQGLIPPAGQTPAQSKPGPEKPRE